MDIWTTLNIPYTTDRDAIKRAFAQQSKLCHPEDNPEGFQVLKDAYKTAILLSENAVLFEAALILENNEASQCRTEPEKDSEVALGSEKSAEMTLQLENHTQKPCVGKKNKSSEGSLDFSELDQKINEIAETREQLKVVIAGELKNAYKYKLTELQYEEFLINTGGDVNIRRKKRVNVIVTGITKWMRLHWVVTGIIIYFFISTFRMILLGG